MRVKIGPYKNWIGPYQIADMIFFWCEKHPDEKLMERWDYKLQDKFGDWLANDKNGDDSRLTKFCQWFESKRKRKIKVKIDNYDTWSMDHTLAYIIVPMLKQLHETKHGAPFVDLCSVWMNLSKCARTVIPMESLCSRCIINLYYMP